MTNLKALEAVIDVIEKHGLDMGEWVSVLSEALLTLMATVDMETLECSATDTFTGEVATMVATLTTTTPCDQTLKESE